MTSLAVVCVISLISLSDCRRLPQGRISHQLAWSARSVSDLLNMTSHFEGGYFRETWRSTDKPGIDVAVDGVPRAVSSSIYYVMDFGNSLTWHRLRGDNIHTWHAGGALKIYMFDPEPRGKLHTMLLGNTFVNRGYEFQVIVPGGNWYTAEVIGYPRFTLWGEIVTPAWEFQDYEDATEEELNRLYPNNSAIIKKYIREI